ncbi:predicted protein [Botrytis cinerea T4]|uniref:Uncharacterized protein n=1 Tax=Botryotinia fuckeliana (strain T4) TaxID=999810 RepID=G2YTD9_BOTF4|nr:predicted protein [Botrytis cinerea T4]
MAYLNFTLFVEKDVCGEAKKSFYIWTVENIFNQGKHAQTYTSTYDLEACLSPGLFTNPMKTVFAPQTSQVRTQGSSEWKGAKFSAQRSSLEATN